MSDQAGPVLDQVNLVVADMSAAVAFYRLLGLRIEDPPSPWDRHHRPALAPDGLDLDLDSREFAQTWDAGLAAGTPTVVLGFRLGSRDAVDQKYDELVDAGYEGQQPPYDAFWGARYAIVADPDGHPVGLMSPADPAMQTQVTPPP
jgi:catechol 2,3-dioxygenase-like lactoylglutathione lyase family enzyme